MALTERGLSEARMFAGCSSIAATRPMRISDNREP
jgi:hypothetical protein